MQGLTPAFVLRHIYDHFHLLCTTHPFGQLRWANRHVRAIHIDINIMATGARHLDGNCCYEPLSGGRGLFSGGYRHLEAVIASGGPRVRIHSHATSVPEKDGTITPTPVAPR